MIRTITSLVCLAATMFSCLSNNETLVNQNQQIVKDTIDLSDTLLPVLERDTFLTYIVDPQIHSIEIFWKNKNNQPFYSLGNVKAHIEQSNRTPLFLTNGGMYMADRQPVGLLIQESEIKAPVNKKSAKNANFYIKPNGIFYIDTSRKANVCVTEDFVFDKSIKYATQSGPMLLVNSKLTQIGHSKSSSVYIRNGVGILPNGNVLFVMSVVEVSFPDFANYFKNAGCTNALYLDGAISKTWLPSKNWRDVEGEFGPIIGVVE